MKPDWKDAPPWAQWLAMDNQGGPEWYWYELKPELKNNFWMQSVSGKVKCALITDGCAENWKDSLERRPERMPDEPQSET